MVLRAQGPAARGRWRDPGRSHLAGSEPVAVSPLIWLITIIAIVALLAFDYFAHVRKAHIPTLREAAVWSAIYVGIALVFGLIVLFVGGSAMGTEYFAGYVTEKALSVDNLFVFLIIISSFRVPREDQQKVLLFGIVFAIIARTGLIFIGAALIDNFSWMFYIFGAILIITAINMLRGGESDESQNVVVRLASRFLHTSEHYDRDHHQQHRRQHPLAVLDGDGRDRRHRHPFRAGFHPGDLRSDPEHLHRVHRDGVLAAGPAPAVLPDRRPARAADLPLAGTVHDPAVHRRQAHPARPARERARFPQRWPAGSGPRGLHRIVADRDLGRADHHRRRLSGQPQGQSGREVRRGQLRDHPPRARDRSR